MGHFSTPIPVTLYSTAGSMASARLHENCAYAILGVSADATDAEIKKAYRSPSASLSLEHCETSPVAEGQGMSGLF